jgi:hypothetical protein
VEKARLKAGDVRLVSRVCRLTMEMLRLDLGTLPNHEPQGDCEEERTDFREQMMLNLGLHFRDRLAALSGAPGGLPDQNHAQFPLRDRAKSPPFPRLPR